MDKYSECIKVGDVLYRIINPTSKMDVPSFFYEKLEKKYDEWTSEKSELSFYDYCINNLKLGIQSIPIPKADLNHSNESKYRAVVSPYKNGKSIYVGYNIGDVVYTIVNGSLIKTKVIKLYDNHIGVYSGELIPYEKQYHEVGQTSRELMNLLKIDNLLDGADKWLEGK